MTLEIIALAVGCFLVCANLAFVAWLSRRMFDANDRALKLLASRDYRDYAAGRIIESRAEKPREMTPTEAAEALEHEQYRIAQNSPHSTI